MMIEENRGDQDWTLVIKPKIKWYEINLKEIWRYRDLLKMFVHRDFVSVYKQTILGPLWFFIQPMLTTLMFIIVFDQVAGIPTDGAPPALFYMSGLVIWNYFSSCLTKTSNTFTNNAGIFGKVYFPRLIVPISTVVSALISFGIQLLLLVVLMLYFHFSFDMKFVINYHLFLLPLLLLIISALGLGLGIIISSMTTKYKDLVFLVSFGVQLLMYATPVIYPLSFLEGKYKSIVLANPIAPIIEIFRYSVLGVGDFSFWMLLYSICVTTVILFLGILIFNRVEKNFMDVV
jgi:lipopolysaccharide transport system permease protein